MLRPCHNQPWREGRARGSYNAEYSIARGAVFPSLTSNLLSPSRSTLRTRDRVYIERRPGLQREKTKQVLARAGASCCRWEPRVTTVYALEAQTYAHHTHSRQTDHRSSVFVCTTTVSASPCWKMEGHLQHLRGPSSDPSSQGAVHTCLLSTTYLYCDHESENSCQAMVGSLRSTAVHEEPLSGRLTKYQHIQTHNKWRYCCTRTLPLYRRLRKIPYPH